ncbi:MAG: hypothetical protein N4J56_001191 [Chroococcidiopsis sp. SAG 2025]|nr:hypothetical protein [Chroococcidiopsis sp. SAG 2025]
MFNLFNLDSSYIVNLEISIREQGVGSRERGAEGQGAEEASGASGARNVFTQCSGAFTVFTQCSASVYCQPSTTNYPLPITHYQFLNNLKPLKVTMTVDPS